MGISQRISKTVASKTSMEITKPATATEDFFFRTIGMIPRMKANTLSAGAAQKRILQKTYGAKPLNPMLTTKQTNDAIAVTKHVMPMNPPLLSMLTLSRGNRLIKS